MGHRRLNLIGPVGGAGVRAVGQPIGPVEAPRKHRWLNLTGMVDDVGVAAPTVHHDGRGCRLAVAKSLLNSSRPALPP